MNEEEFNNFFAYYYQSGTPDKTAEALEYVIDSELINLRPKSDTFAYFFAKIAENDPTVLKKYNTVFRKIPHKGRVFILKVMEWLHNEDAKDFLTAIHQKEVYKEEKNAVEEILRYISSTKKMDIFQKNINTGFDLDLLWVEFVVTGNKKAVLRIIDVLELDDKVREKLCDWLKSEPHKKLLGKWSHKRNLKKIVSAGILLDYNLKNILSAQDLDCHFFMDGCNYSSEIFKEGQDQLPFQLSQNEKNHIGLKIAAKWSLCSNANQHPIVLETITSEASKRVGHCRLSLLEIISRNALASDDLETAFNSLYKSFDPYPSIRHKQIDNASANFQQLLALPDKELMKDTNINAKELVKSSIDVTKKVSSYMSKIILEGSKLGQSPSTILTRQLEHVKPDKFRVSKQAGEDYDEWVTIGHEHFRSPMYNNIKELDLSIDEMDLNKSLLVDRYFKPMRETYPNSINTYKSDGNEYYQVVYKGDATEQFESDLLFQEDNGSDVAELDRVHIWLEKDTLHIIRVDLVVKQIVDEESSPIRGRYVQLFTNFNESLAIVPPAFVIFEHKPTN